MHKRALLPLLAAAGLAALSWEILWTHHATLALGASARGAAITLAVTMGGMTLGALGMARWLRGRRVVNPTRIYALLEVAMGVLGLSVPWMFQAIGVADTAMASISPLFADILDLVLIALALGPSAAAMGATIPLFGIMAERSGLLLSRLYGINTLGAALGVIGMAFWLLCELGVTLTGIVVSLINFSVAAVARSIRLPSDDAERETPLDTVPEDQRAVSMRVASLVVFTTGFATFFLEVAWFRALRSALNSTTDSLALILAAVLIPLGAAAETVGFIRRRRVALGSILVITGILVLVATPAIERFDQFVPTSGSYFFLVVGRFAWSLLLMGPSVFVLGMALPWLLDEARTPLRWGRLYATNTLGAVCGALAAAWVALPNIGIAKSAWLAGGIVATLGIALSRGMTRILAIGGAAAALAAAALGQSGLGATRVIDPSAIEGQTVVESRDGPDSTVSVVDNPRFGRVLIIDGFYATGETATAHYMDWMGRLPMLVHPRPDEALVICFGTGQTANAVRNEGAKRTDVVDLSAAVFALAPHFAMNEGVLRDQTVSAHVMDGRAWLRRTRRTYDVITLEPMPPNHAGMNALYSAEFYELAARRLKPGGTIAQWLPFHLATPRHSMAIARAFVETFPNAILWVDPVDRTGILLGQRENDPPIASSWPGFARAGRGRSLSFDQTRRAVMLDGIALHVYAAQADPVTDDNQVLAFPTTSERAKAISVNMHDANLAIIRAFRTSKLDPSGPHP